MGHTTSRDCSVAFTRAAIATRCEESAGFNLFKPVLQPLMYDGGGPDVNTGDGWAAFGLEPVLEWPLQLIFDSDAIAKYNSVLAFFFRVLRVQTRLHETWALGKKANGADEKTVNLLPRVWSLRSRMSFLV